MVGVGQTLDGDQESLSLALVTAPDFGDHGALVIAKHPEEVHPVDRPFADLQPFSIQSSTICQVQVPDVGQENAQLCIEIRICPVAVQFVMGRVVAHIKTHGGDELSNFISIYEGIGQPLPAKIPGVWGHVFKEQFNTFIVQLVNRSAQVVIKRLPVFDRMGKYKGVIEISQDITHIKTLEGERRLLDW